MLIDECQPPFAREGCFYALGVTAQRCEAAVHVLSQLAKRTWTALPQKLTGSRPKQSYRLTDRPYLTRLLKVGADAQVKLIDQPDSDFLLRITRSALFRRGSHR